MIQSKDSKFSYTDFENAITKLRSCDPAERDLDSQAIYEIALRVEERVQRALATEANVHVRAALTEILNCCDDPKFISTMARYFESDSADMQFWSYVVLAQVGTPNALELANEKSVVDLLDSCVTEEEIRALGLKSLTGN